MMARSSAKEEGDLPAGRWESMTAPRPTPPSMEHACSSGLDRSASLE
jgi:hypothetical protein